MRHKQHVIHIRLRRGTHQELRVTCARRGETIQSFVEMAVRRALQEPDGGWSTGAETPPRRLRESPSTTVYEPMTEGDRSTLRGADRSMGGAIDEVPYTDTAGMGDQAADVLASLAQQDWTFANADTREGAHALHPYPAKFIPQIPRTLVNALHPRDGSVTLDPFCGSGTTLLESILQGIPAIGVDVNPLAVLVARVKTTPLSEPLDAAIAAIVQAVSLRYADVGETSLPDIPRLDHWFKPEISQVVSMLLEEIEAAGLEEGPTDALRVALSRILVRVSNQESDVRYAAIEKPVGPEQVVGLFEAAAMHISHLLTRTLGSPLFPELRPAEATVIHADARGLHENLPPWRVGLIVCSPPYPNAYEYWLYHKYRMYWLGMDPIAAREDEIGARAHYSKANGLTAQDFANDMERCFRGFAALLPSGRYACFVIGNSRIRGTYVDNGELLTQVAQDHGFTLRARFPRRIPRTKTAFNPSIGSIRRESLLLFQRT